MIRSTLIATFVIFTAVSSYTPQTINSNAIVYTIDHEYMEGCETGKGDCKPIVLTRHSLQDSVKVIFPGGGTSSSVFLYTTKEFIQWFKGTPNDQPKPLRHDHKYSGEGRPAIDLTGLPDGKYSAHMLSCNLGGFLELFIVTEKNEK